MNNESSSIETAGGRIARFRASLKLSQQAFADEIGVSRSYVGSIEINRIEPSREFLKKLYRRFKVNAGWVLYGDGDMYAKPDTMPGLAFPGDYSAEEWRNIVQQERSALQAREEAVDALAGDGLSEVHYWSCEGTGIEKGRMPFPDWMLARILLSGDSLALLDGFGAELLFVDLADSTITSGQRYLLRIDEEHLVRYINRRPGGLFVATGDEGPKHGIGFKREDIESGEVEIFGRVIGEISVSS